MKNSSIGINLVVAPFLFYTSAFAVDLLDGVPKKMILGGVEGLIAGVLLVLYIWVWKPMRKRAAIAQTARRAAKQQIPEVAIAAAEGNNDEVLSLIEKGVDVNASGISGETALMLASKNGHPLTVRLLLKNGANPHAKTKLNNTARDIARKSKEFMIADILTDAMGYDATH